ncbi:hypothetical protein ACIQHU_39475 [Streptomyces tendae]|uniref:hypothetical protein n=1 Tax=Streptomyces tendae TaxID=1932 RepID=UPI00381072C7
MTDPTTDVHVAEARRNVHEALVLLPAWEADRVRSLIADLESAVESRTAVRMADAASAVSLPPADQTALPVAEARERLRGMALTLATGEGPLVEPWAFNQALDDYQAAVAAAVLPATTDRRAVLREAADRAEIVALRLRLKHDVGAANGAYEVMTELRRMADETQPAETEAEPTAEEIARDHVTTLHLIGEQLATIEGWFWEHLADVRAAEQSAAGARQDGEQP